ncbi:MAG: HTH-type transcriptional activator RhaS [Chroococcidiopsis sp. SAG 2025]|uniref:AraC family transcriptional regulator n=1 Tax=Chroococcidiopsis sp. SAG 2025 TaxID=171389 RepID=UPI0029373915|nr:AraC family transcriptional regulator [Chroococcidiopsis sp. SAG 2025]MDV2997957.1 HTH-type transcriptional activator RhaS [Chroococcidiopsis sp. SAG 2025]
MTDRLIVDRCRELAALINRHTNGDGFHQTSIAPLGFTRESSTSTRLHGVSTPMLAIVVQGKKGAALGEEIYRYGEAQYLVVSVDQPISGFIIEATPDRPYLGFKLELDPRELCEIIAVQTNALAKPLRMRIAGKKETSVRGFFVSTADVSLLDCALRLTRLLDTPQDIPILAPMMIREIYYRLLIGEQSEAVRQIATSGSNMQRIAAVIQSIKVDFTKPMRVAELAEQASMSPSSFHHHFKQVTSMSPLQYQKQLRLLEARRLMLAENYNAITAADRVGYESPSQFSREYARLFGAPPIQDIGRLLSVS